MATSHADRARLSHRILRLREFGVDNERSLRRLAGAAKLEDTPEGQPRDVTVGGDGSHPMVQIAAWTVPFLDEDQPGPTDAKLVEHLMGRENLGDIWEEWNDAVTANLEETLDNDALQAWRDSVAQDQSAAQDAWDDAGFDEGDVHPYFGHGRHLDGAANAIYDVGRKGFADGAIALLVATIKVVLVDSADYTVNLATDQFLSSVASAGREETSAALTTKTTTAGVFDADDTSFPAAAGDPCEALVIVQSSAVGGGADVADTAQRLIGYIDTATGLPVTLNGGAVNVTFDAGSNRIFKL